MPIMPYEEYSRLKHAVPYVFKIQKENKFLYYFGEKHSYDLNDGQWNLAREFWTEFLEKTKDQNRIVFIESDRSVIKETEEKSITEAGGTGFISWHATKENINIYSPRPRRKLEMDELAKLFSKDMAEYYCFARIVDQWHRMTEPKPEFEKYVAGYLERDKRESEWTGFNFSLENIKKIHKEIFGTDFNENDKKFFESIVTPVEMNTKLNYVARVSSDFRNEYIVKEIQKYWDMGYSIYIHYGHSHAVVQEPALREILK